MKAVKNLKREINNVEIISYWRCKKCGGIYGDVIELLTHIRLGCKRLTK